MAAPKINHFKLVIWRWKFSDVTMNLDIVDRREWEKRVTAVVIIAIDAPCPVLLKEKLKITGKG